MKWLIIFSLLVPLLVACGSDDISDISETYPLESVSRDGKSTSYIYRAENTTVPEAAKSLADKRTPKQQSKQSEERMFLVYDHEWIQVQRDKDKPEDAIIEVDSEAYVKQNYDRSFLEMYFQYKLLDTLFDSLSGSGKYRGYTERRTYEPTRSYHKPTKEETKKAPPMTVERKGSMFRRDSSTGTSKNTNGDFSSRQPKNNGTRGSISRGSSEGSYHPPKVRKSKQPKVRSGSGRIFKRGRR